MQNVKLNCGIDMPIIGYGGRTVNTLRLWSAKAVEDFNFADFNDGSYARAVPDKVKAENKIKEAGKETVLGRECTKYTMESSQMGMTMSQTVWVWNGIVLKSLTDGGQFQFGNTATKLEENATIPASTFDIPKF